MFSLKMVKTKKRIYRSSMVVTNHAKAAQYAKQLASYLLKVRTGRYRTPVWKPTYAKKKFGLAARGLRRLP